MSRGFKMRKIFLIILVILAIVSVSAVSASENITADDSLLSESSQENPNDNTYNSEITAKYDEPNERVKIYVKENYGEKEDALVEKVKCKFDNRTTKSTDSYIDGYNGAFYAISTSSLDKGKHQAEIRIVDSFYKAKPILFDFTVNKKIATLHAVKITTTSDIILKATVKCNGKNVNEGKVTFKIKGKSYTASVKNGIATKKIKLGNGYYTYKATFKSSKFSAKSSSNHAIKGNKYYTFKQKGVYGGTYSINIPFKKYLKLVEAKRNGYYKYFTLKTGKTDKFISSKEIYTTKTVYKWKQVKVLDYTSYWDTQESYSYSLSKYYTNGWTYIGGYDKTYSNGYDHYSIFKKKVKTTQRVYVGSKTVYSSKSYPLRFFIGVNENSKLYCEWDITRENQLKACIVIPHWSGRL